MANNILVQAAVVAILFSIVSTNSINIDVQSQVVGPNDKKVVFACTGGNDTKKTFVKMLRMRLMKLQDDDQWTEIAVLRTDGSIVMNHATATAVGRIGDMLDSNLVVTWPVAADDVSGRYRCDVMMLTSTWDVATMESRELVFNGHSTDISILLDRLKKHDETLVRKVNETMYGAVRFSKADLLSILDSKFKNLKEYLVNKTDATIRKPEEDVETMQNWPAGNMTLLMPSAGCPRHPPAWIKSFVKMKVPSVDKYYPIDVPLHLANPHKKDGFIYRQYCTLPASTERSQPWPAGSYCIRKIGNIKINICPTGFQYVKARVKVLNDKGNIFLYYYPENSQASWHFTLYNTRFCCRHDGNASTPIELPATHPFYLSRHGGRCQEVKGMDVTQDVFMMETVADDSNDKWMVGDADFYPDVFFQTIQRRIVLLFEKKGLNLEHCPRY